jgi:Spy/CpxP family protein refolding chaperone
MTNLELQVLRPCAIAILIAALTGTASTATPGHSPHAGDESADIKALTADELAALLDGQGMGFARAAELNGYPGPRHVLDLASQLGLTAAQAARTRALFDRMREAARAEGARLVDAERALDRLYATRTATAEKVAEHLERIETIRARLRAVHLNAHLEQTAMLTAGQIERYSRLRGYGGTLPAPGHHHGT